MWKGEHQGQTALQCGDREGALFQREWQTPQRCTLHGNVSQTSTSVAHTRAKAAINQIMRGGERRQERMRTEYMKTESSEALRDDSGASNRLFFSLLSFYNIIDDYSSFYVSTTFILSFI